jgi:hypothetical protein
VDFYADGDYVGSADVSSGGVAMFQVSSLAVGDESLTAVYDGVDLYNDSSSGSLAHIVLANIPTVGLTTSADTIVYGQTVTFTVTVSPPFGGGFGGLGSRPTGQVDFFDNDVYIGSANLVNGSASLSDAATDFLISTLSVGSNSITAVYDGDSRYSGQSSDPLTETVTD